MFPAIWVQWRSSGLVATRTTTTVLEPLPCPAPHLDQPAQLAQGAWLTFWTPQPPNLEADIPSGAQGLQCFDCHQSQSWCCWWNVSSSSESLAQLFSLVRSHGNNFHWLIALVFNRCLLAVWPVNYSICLCCTPPLLGALDIKKITEPKEKWQIPRELWALLAAGDEPPYLCSACKNALGSISQLAAWGKHSNTLNLGLGLEAACINI